MYRDEQGKPFFFKERKVGRRTGYEITYTDEPTHKQMLKRHQLRKKRKRK